MADDVSAFFEAWQTDRQKMEAEIPALCGSFATFHPAVMKEGALSVRDKECPGHRLGGSLHSVH